MMCVRLAGSSRLLRVYLSIFISFWAYGAAEAGKYQTSIAVIDMAKVLREHPRLQQGLADLKREMNEQGNVSQQQEAEYSKRAARLYHQAHKEIRVRVEEFAERNGIDLVLDFDSSNVDIDDPEEIMQRLTDRVVYQARLNITEHVIAMLQRR